MALAIAVPVLAWTLWPLVRPSGAARRWLAVPPDEREALEERKRAALRALRELAFEHESGHVSDADYDDLRARYEAEAAAALRGLDRLPPVARRPAEAPATSPARRARGWRHPAAIVTTAAALVVFGVALGAGITRYTAPDPMAGVPQPGSRPLAGMPPAAEGQPPAAGGAPRAVSPDVLRGMLEAARTSLFAGRYSEAIAAYQAVLKRDPKNVDAMTHLALIVAIGGHADAALETFDKALSIDPNYAPALLYRGEVLLESKHDAKAAIASWEKFVAITPSGQDRERVQRMIAEARARPPAAAAPAPGVSERR